jgi:hypothetical protein
MLSKGRFDHFVAPFRFASPAPQPVRRFAKKLCVLCVDRFCRGLGHKRKKLTAKDAEFFAKDAKGSLLLAATTLACYLLLSASCRRPQEFPIPRHFIWVNMQIGGGD